MAGLMLLLVPGCGGGAKAPATPAADTTAQAGTICDTVLDTAGAAVVQPDSEQPELVNKEAPRPRDPRPEPEKVTERPRELPKMWDFGSENCIPCKTMLGILTPMMKDYEGKVDIRIINVYEDKELTKQFKIVTIPTQVFIDAAGREIFRHIGVYPRDSIEARFREFGMPIITGAVVPAKGSECLT
jgi:thioredoxin 1